MLQLLRHDTLGNLNSTYPCVVVKLRIFNNYLTLFWFGTKIFHPLQRTSYPRILAPLKKSYGCLLGLEPVTYGAPQLAPKFNNHSNSLNVFTPNSNWFQDRIKHILTIQTS